MSLFSFFGPTIKYSQHERQLTSLELSRLFQHIHLATVSQANKETVMNAILARRGSDDKISLQQIYELLNHLWRENEITKIDRNTFIKLFEEYFEKHFNG